jgi:hypothetical protein
MKAQFLLIQDGVVDYSENPGNLAYSFVDAFAGFQVAIGCVNEFGEREIIGIVADVAPVSGCNTWRVSSYQDGYNRLVGATGSPAAHVRVRLGVLYENGYFADLCNLPQPVTVMPGKPAEALVS